MKITYIGKFKKLHDEEGFAKSLEAIGHEVHRIEDFTVSNVQQVLQQRPDVVISPKFRILPEIHTALLDYCRLHGVKTATVVPDLYFGLRREARVVGRDAMFRTNYVFTPDGGHDERWQKLGISHHLLRQGIYHTEIYKGQEIPAPEIVFVGTHNPEYPYRKKVIDFLTRAYGNRFKMYGVHNSDAVRGGDLNNLYASAKIVVGDSVFSPWYWSNRIYETIGRGGFIIHPMVAGLDQEYTPYKHFIPYSIGDFAGLKEKIDYFLKHDGERKAIVDAGMKHTKDNHTLIHRANEFSRVLWPSHN